MGLEERPAGLVRCATVYRDQEKGRPVRAAPILRICAHTRPYPTSPHHTKPYLTPPHPTWPHRQSQDTLGEGFSGIDRRVHFGQYFEADGMTVTKNQGPKTATKTATNQIARALRGSPRKALKSFILYLVRRGGLEPPRCYPLAPQASASANSAISAGEVYFCCGACWGGTGTTGT
jgi:hypothetical protein